MEKDKKGIRKGMLVEHLAIKITKAAGSSGACITALLIVIIWLLCGPYFNYSDKWQLVITTGGTVTTFLMVFLIQKSQNKDSLAIQLKLNELVAAHEFASNRLVDIENITEEELKIIQKYYTKLSTFTKNEDNLHQSHSIDESHEMHDLKKEMEQELEEKLKNLKK